MRAVRKSFAAVVKCSLVALPGPEANLDPQNHARNSR
jgi:hypothetical protein